MNMLKLGRLFDLQWKLGVSISSSNCSNLSAPFVSLSYKVSDTNGKAKGYSMELSFPEFQVFNNDLCLLVSFIIKFLNSLFVQEFLSKMKAIANHMDSL